MYPLYDREPLRVALAHRRTQRLFGDYFWQHSVVLGSCLLDAYRIETGPIRRKSVAAIGQVSLHRLIVVWKRDRLVAQVVAGEIVSEVEFASGPGTHAYCGTIEILNRLHSPRDFHQEGLPIVVVHADKGELSRTVALAGPRGIANENVDLTRFQICKSLQPRRRKIRNSRRIIQHRCRNGLAVVDIDTLPITFTVGLTESGERCIDAAIQGAALFHVV